MAAQAPSIEEAALVSSSTSEADHHTGGTSSLAEGGRVVHSDLRRIAATIEFDPREGGLFNTEAPYITNCLLSSVSSEHQEMRLREDDGVTIPPSGGGSHHGHNHPLGLIFAVSHIEQVQVVTRQTASACGSSIYNHLHLLDVGRGMGSSGRGRDSLNVEFCPGFEEDVKDKGFTCHRVSSGVTGSSSEEHHFVLVHHGDGVAESGLGHVLCNF
mmetsp:Transcript_4409/g.6434  ORF Transcript_4409/g.6434 Transcript_4409/m.6434 type:complete len:214 (+) Transcript_4409:1758-2399(+)